MKSIENTLKLINNTIKSFGKSAKIEIALIGGYSAIAHGVDRTTSDIDFCVYPNYGKNISDFVKKLKQIMHSNFKITFTEGSKISDDPFKHDVIFINDKSRQYTRIDFIIARYKWELEGIKTAKALKDIDFPVLPKPYLIAMKLKADSLKDDYDIIELYKLLTKKEKAETLKLAKLIRRDKKLKILLKPKKVVTEKEDKEQLI